MAKGVPLGEWSGSAATDRLHATIQAYTDTATEQTAQLTRFTRQLVWLTWLLFAGLLVQIILSFFN